MAAGGVGADIIWHVFFSSPNLLLLFGVRSAVVISYTDWRHGFARTKHAFDVILHRRPCDIDAVAVPRVDLSDVALEKNVRWVVTFFSQARQGGGIVGPRLDLGWLHRDLCVDLVAVD